MKAIVLREVKNFESLRLEDVPSPAPGPGEVLVQIKASALNHRDIWIIQGLYARVKVPIVLGSDGSGIVGRIGKGVAGDWLNKPVLINPSIDWGTNPAVQQDTFRILGMPDNGTQAEYVVVPAKNLVAKPDYLTFEEAAAIPLAGLTGYRALFTQGRLQPGEMVLITGIGGGVAALMLQMALSVDAKVVVTSGSDAKIQRAVAMGAIGGANYRHPDWAKEIRSLVGHRGIDLIVDSAGGEGFNALISLVKPAGRIVFFGATAGNPSSVNLRRIFWRQITLQGTTMGNEDDFQQMVSLFEKQRIKPIMDKIYPFTQYQQAYLRMMKGEQFGKIILVPDSNKD